MADDSKILEALTTIVDRASGKAATPRVNWAQFKRPGVPVKVQAGYGVVTDQFMAGAQELELFSLCEGTRNASCNPVHGIERGPMVMGALFPQIKGGELVVHQYTPYPQFRQEDGRPHIMNGSCIYPHLVNPTGWQEVAGTYYNRSSALGAEWMRKAQAATAPPASPQPTRENKNA